MSTFKFKYFSVQQATSTMKVGTDAMLLGSLINSSDKLRGLDIGAGTGVISLMVAQVNPKIQIDAIELDELSVKECAKNFLNSPWSSRLNSFQADFKSYDSKEKYDLLFSNPPYYQSTLVNDDSREALAKHVGELTPERLIEKAEFLLNKTGALWLIVPYSDVQHWIDAALNCSLYPAQQIEINGKEDDVPKRVVICFERSIKAIEVFHLTVRAENGNYTPDYISLTKEFHFVTLTP
ncbi:MAG: methyltransferase [Crocinitomicaceae bacterium]|nr:methyltransferase [Crocinitomicaceae bacterium]